MSYPSQRPRRLRLNPVLRTTTEETTLEIRNFIYPLFVTAGKGKPKTSLLHRGHK